MVDHTNKNTTKNSNDNTNTNNNREPTYYNSNSPHNKKMKLYLDFVAA